MKITFVAPVIVCLAVSACARGNNMSWLSSDRGVEKAQSYSAVLKSKRGKTAYRAKVDVKNNVIKVRRIAGRPKPGKSHELWAISSSNSKPLSLGVIGSVSEVDLARLGSVRPEGITLAVSQEPQGGSPTGEVTGPVLFTGKVAILRRIRELEG